MLQYVVFVLDEKNYIEYLTRNTTSLFINLSAKMHEFPLHCISAQTGYIALAIEIMKLQIISKHFNYSK